MNQSATVEPHTNGTSTNVSPITASSIHAKMARAQAALERVAKNGVNKHFDYKFASESDIKDAVRGVCAAEGLFVHATVLPDSIVESDVTTRSGQSLAVKLTVKLTVFDAEGQSIEPTFATGYAIDSSDKAYNKAQTAGIKFATIAAFNVSTGDDPDGQSPEHGSRTQTTAKQTPAPPQEPRRVKISSEQVNDIRTEARINALSPDDLKIIASQVCKRDVKLLSDLTFLEGSALLNHIRKMEYLSYIGPEREKRAKAEADAAAMDPDGDAEVTF